MSSTKKKSGVGKNGEEAISKQQSWPFDPTVMVCIESGVDGTRIFADRNCVATCRRLADLIPPLIPPPPPPLDPKEAKKLAASQMKASNRKGGPNTSASAIEASMMLQHQTENQETNRGPSAVSPLFDEDVGGQQPKTSGKLVLERVDRDVVARGELDSAVKIAGFDDDQQQQQQQNNNNSNTEDEAETSGTAAYNNNTSTTPVIPVVKIECLSGRQIEAAIRIAYYKYMGDHVSDVEKRKAIPFDSLEVTAEELLAIGTILGC